MRCPLRHQRSAAKDTFQRKVWSTRPVSQFLNRAVVGVTIEETAVTLAFGVVTECIKVDGLGDGHASVEENTGPLGIGISPRLHYVTFQDALAVAAMNAGSVA